MTLWIDFETTLGTWGIRIDRGRLDLFPKLRELVLAENERQNLTRIVDEREFLEKHLLDSLAGLASVGESVRRAVDVGSGAGFPGLALAIARPEWSFALVESAQKKAGFLVRAARELGLANVSVVAERAEEAAKRPEHRDAYDLATVRAVASAAVTVELALPFVRPGGRALLYRGPEDAAADETAGRAAAPLLGGGAVSVRRLELPSGAKRIIIIVDKGSPTPPGFPRRAGLAEKRPLA
jgi:16S rRNA (guanine527-N7)-methyltransferase